MKAHRAKIMSYQHKLLMENPKSLNNWRALLGYSVSSSQIAAAEIARKRCSQPFSPLLVALKFSKT